MGAVSAVTTEPSSGLKYPQSVFMSIWMTAPNGLPDSQNRGIHKRIIVRRKFRYIGIDDRVQVLPNECQQIFGASDSGWKL